MANQRLFPYVSIRNANGEVGSRPLLPITLAYNNKKTETSGLLDTGADVNVLPYQLGLDLGCVWDNQQTIVRLSGNMGNYEARGVILEATIADFAPVKLAFAWTRAQSVPLILGQVNFFLEFDVCFFRSRSSFEITPKDS